MLGDIQIPYSIDWISLSVLSLVEGGGGVQMIRYRGISKSRIGDEWFYGIPSNVVIPIHGRNDKLALLQKRW